MCIVAKGRSQIFNCLKGAMVAQKQVCMMVESKQHLQGKPLKAESRDTPILHGNVIGAVAHAMQQVPHYDQIVFGRVIPIVP